jgi:hypothetical protein
MGGSFTKTKCMDRLFKQSEGVHALVPGCVNQMEVDFFQFFDRQQFLMSKTITD